MAASALCGPSLRPRKPWALLTRVFFYSLCHVFVCVPRLELHPRWQRGPCLVLAPGFFVLGSRLVLGSGLAVPACAPVCLQVPCLALVPSLLDPLLLQVHRLPRWRMPRPCSVLLLCSEFRVVSGFWCEGFWFLLVCARLPVAASALWSSPGTLPFLVSSLTRMCHVLVCVPRLELRRRRRCPFFIGFLLGSDPRPRCGCS